jgi:ATP-dependent helicase/nuclease subunit B
METFKMNKKILIVPNYAIADQVVRMVNDAGIPCINLVCKTIRDLVVELCQSEAALQDNELRFIGEEVATNLMMDIMSEKRSELRYFIHEEWIDIPTAREIMRQIMDLRLVKAQENLKADADTDKIKDLNILFDCYDKRLSEADLLDYSALLIKAIDLLNQEKSLSPIKYGIFANTRAIGLERAFINTLIGAEAYIIKAHLVAGFDRPVTNYADDPRAYTVGNELSRLYGDESFRINAPTIDFFRSYGQINEFKYVLQDIIRKGYPFGAVQVIFTDSSYSLFLYNTAQSMGINLSLPGGVPGCYTEIYAFLRDLFTFIKKGYFAEALKPVFFNRILQLGADSRSNRSLFDHFLSQGIGFGRTRYEKFIQRSDRNTLRPNKLHDDSVAEGEDNGDDAILEAFIQAILELFPSDLMEPVEVKGFTEQVVMFIECYYTRDNANGDDQRECQQVASALCEFAKLSTTKLSATIVMDQILLILEGLCVKSTPASDDAILATSLSTTGYVIRPYVYVIGLDAGRFPVKANESPVLLDAERQQLGLNFDLSAQVESGSIYRLLESLSGDIKQLILGYNYFDTVGIKEKNASSFYNRLLENQGIKKRDIHKSGFIGDPQMILEAKEYYLHATKVNMEQKIVVRTPCNHWNQLKPAEETIDSLSASSLTTFLDCPRKYYFQYRAQLTPPEQFDDDRTIWLDPLNKGTFIHKVLEDYVYQGIIGDKERVFKETLFQKIFDKNCKKMAEKVPYLSRETYEMQCRHLLTDTRANLNHLCDDMKQEAFIPVATELSFGMRGEEMVEIKLLNGESLKLRGAIDRVDKLSDGTYRIVDYKTGKYANIKKKREQGADALIQDYLYAVVLEDLYKKHSAIVSESRYDFPCDRQKHLVTAITAETRKGLFDQLAIITDKIRTGSYKRCKSDPERYRNWETTCSYCNYENLCQAEACAWEETDGR